MLKAVLTKFNFRNQKGLSLIELMVAMAFFVLVVSGVIFLVLDAYSANRQGAERTRATLIAQEGLEAARSIKDRGWKYLTTGVYGVNDVNGFWDFGAGQDSIDQFTRQVKVENVSRQNGEIVASGGTVDFDTKKVTSEVDWNFTPLRPSHVSLETYFTNWKSKKWTQTTVADFQGGTLNNTAVTNQSGGEVQLATAANSYWGNQFLINSTTSIGAMTSNSQITDLRFTAQNSNTVTAVRVYVDQYGSVPPSSPVYTFGLQSDNGSGYPDGTWLGSGVYTPSGTGWQTISLNTPVTLNKLQVYHLVVQGRLALSKKSYISLRESLPQNSLVPLNNASDSNANVLWNSGTGWSVLNSQPIYELDYADNTYEGNPYISGQDEAIYGPNYVSEKITVTSQNMNISEISFKVKKNKNQSPADNLIVTLLTGNTVIEQGTLVSAGDPTLTTSYGPWYIYKLSRQETLSVGQTYRIYLSSSGANSNFYYQVSSVSAFDSSNFDGITFDGINSVFSSSSNSGDGWSDRNYSDISGFKLTVVNGYALSGDFTSTIFDTSLETTNYNYIAWTADVPAGTTLKFQIKVDGSKKSWSDWMGPNGTSSTYFTVDGDTMPDLTDVANIGTRWIQYKAFFTSANGQNTPILKDITIDYEQ